MSSRRLAALAGAVALLLVGAASAVAVDATGPVPPPKALDQAVYDALTAPETPGVTARVTFENKLIPASALPDGTASPLLQGASGRLWLAQDGRFRVELQSEAGDAQIVSDGKVVTAYDASANTVYRAELPPEKTDEKKEGDEHRPTLARVQKGLERLAEHWLVSGANPGSSAGQPSYTVRLSPKDDGGLLAAAELAWDAARGVPLRAAVYADGQADPVLSLTADEISYAAVAESELVLTPPAGAKVVDVDPRGREKEEHGEPVEGLEAVQARVPFKIAAPDGLAGRPRTEVRLIEKEKSAGAALVYGEGHGAVVIFQHRTRDESKPDGRVESGERELVLPAVDVAGVRGEELATPLGTVITFERDGITYTVAGSLPPATVEAAARELR